MKNNYFKIFTLLISLIAISCDQPRDRRTASTNSTDQQSPQNFEFDFNSGGDGRNTGSDGEYNIDDQGSGSGSHGQIPVQVSHCRWPGTSGGAYAHQHHHLGQYTVCQSTQQDTDIYIQVRDPVTDSNLCLIPTYHSNDKAVFIGEPRCFKAEKTDTIYRIGLLKNRTGYSNFNVTGVMIMRDRAYFYPHPYNQNLLSPDAYLFCSQWLDQYGDPTYCQAFDAVGQYIYHRF